jgi:putative restriction endonuclease
MKKGQKLWTREELILGINLYCKLPFGKIHKGNTEIIKLANLIGRTPSAISRKLGNFASFDPSLKERGIGGLPNSSKLDGEIWKEFYNNWEDLAFESEKLRAEYGNTSIELISDISEMEITKLGLERNKLVKMRVNQSFFRKSILAAYNYTCCITGLNHSDFLVAGHIKPWSIDERNRLNPRNGICINPLHDKAFELGYMTIDLDFKIHISSVLSKLIKNDDQIGFFKKYHKSQIILPKRFLPDPEFLKYHMDVKFKG